MTEMQIGKIAVAETNEDKLLQNPMIRLLIGLALALGFLISGFYTMNKANTLSREGIEAQGVVTSIRTARGRRGRKMFYPTVQFTDKNGQSHTQELGNQSGIQENQKLTLVYLPSKPSVVVIKNAGSLSPVPGYCLMGTSVIGWAIVIYNIFFMIRAKRIRKKDENYGSQEAA